MFTSTISRTIARVWTEGRGLRRWFLPLLVLLALIWPHPAAAQSPGETGLPPKADAVARTINGLRAQAGLPPLRVHPLLTQAAALHIQDMVTSGHYGHTGSDGSNVHQRVARTGYVVDGWAGEIWAAYGTVEQAFAMWMESPPHRESILNPHYQEMGVATGWHPNGRQLIIVVDFATGSQNQAPGQALLPSPAAPVVVDPPADGRYTVQPGDTLST
ncbi:MAG: CAP domain-containing protein, partial [Caldilineae bacterium]